MSENQGNFDEIVQACLTSLASGQETLHSAVERYASKDADLRPRLETALWLAANKNAFAPRPGFVSASRSRLMERIRQEPLAASQARPGLTAGLAQFFKSLRLQPQMAFALALTLVLTFSALFAGRATITVAAASIPGDRLYSAKVFLEETRLAFTAGEAADARLHMDFAGSRIAELDGLVARQRYALVASTIDNYGRQLDEAVSPVQVLVAKNAPLAKTMAETFTAAITGHQKKLADLIAAAPAQVQTDLARAQALSQGGFDLAQDVILRADSLVLLTFTPTATPSATIVLPTKTAAVETILPVTITALPLDGAITPAATTPAFPYLTASPTSPVKMTPTPGVQVTPVPAVEDEEPAPTKKPTKTPKTLPDPTRRPPKPTPKP